MTRYAHVLFAILTAAAAYADCGPGRWAVVEVEIRSCETAEAFASRESECERAWTAVLRKRMMERSAGMLVVTGTIVSRQEITMLSAQTATAGPREPADETSTWVIAAHEKMSCSTVTPGTVMPLFLAPRCCDVLPPADFACWYELDRLGPVPEAAANAIGMTRR